MKKRMLMILILTVLCLSSGYTNNANGASYNNCNTRYIESVKEMDGCQKDSLIPIREKTSEHMFVALGIENNQCHIRKKEIRHPDLTIGAVSDCYVPMSDYNRAYNLFLQYANTRCNTSDYYSSEEIREQANNIILNYCR